MNPSSQLSFEESSPWNPKIIRKRLIVSQDQLAKLNSIPGWAKVQDHQSTFLAKDFSIEISQAESFAAVTQQKKERSERNIELFDKYIKKHKSIFEVFGGKLTRSLSLFTINKSSENLLNLKTVKRTLSLQSICQSFSASGTNNHFKDYECECSQADFYVKNTHLDKLHIVSDQCKVPNFKPQNNKSFLSAEKNSKTMETVSQLPVNIPTNENATFHFGSAKETNGLLPVENAVTGLPQQLKKQVVIESLSNDVQLQSEIMKVNNVLQTGNVDSHSETGKENYVPTPDNAATEFAELEKEIMVESVNNDDIHLQSEITKVNDDVLQLNADLHSETGKESYGVLPADNASIVSVDTSNQFVKHIAESMNTDNTNELSKNTKENSDVLPIIINIASCSNNVPDESVLTIADSIDKSVSSSNKFALSHVPISNKLETSNVTAIISASNNEGVLPLTMQEQEKCSFNLCNTNETSSFIVKEKDPLNCATDLKDKNSKSNSDVLQDNSSPVSIISDLKCIGKVVCKNAAIASMEESNDANVHELRRSSLIAEDIPAKELNISEDESKAENFTCGMKENDKECNDKTCDPSNSEISFSKKRKLESRNKRSKRLKSEEKQGNLKIRSIKKVGEICYSVEEVKTMLEIMKHIL